MPEHFVLDERSHICLSFVVCREDGIAKPWRRSSILTFLNIPKLLSMTANDEMPVCWVFAEFLKWCVLRTTSFWGGSVSVPDLYQGRLTKGKKRQLHINAEFTSLSRTRNKSPVESRSMISTNWRPARHQQVWSSVFLPTQAHDSSVFGQFLGIIFFLTELHVPTKRGSVDYSISRTYSASRSYTTPTSQNVTITWYRLSRSKVYSSHTLLTFLTPLNQERWSSAT